MSPSAPSASDSSRHGSTVLTEAVAVAAGVVDAAAAVDAASAAVDSCTREITLEAVRCVVPRLECPAA